MGCTPCEEAARRQAAEIAASRPEMIYVIINQDQHELARFDADGFTEAVEFQQANGGSIRMVAKDVQVSA